MGKSRENFKINGLEPGIKVEKNGQGKIDYNLFFLNKTIEDINKNNLIFKLNPGDVQYDGESFIVDQKKMTLYELTNYVAGLNNIEKNELLKRVRQQHEKEEEEKDYHRRNFNNG